MSQEQYKTLTLRLTPSLDRIISAVVTTEERMPLIASAPLPENAPAPRFAMHQRVQWVEDSMMTTGRVSGIMWSSQSTVNALGHHYLIEVDLLTVAAYRGIERTWVFEDFLAPISDANLSDLINEIRELQ